MPSEPSSTPAASSPAVAIARGLLGGLGVLDDVAGLEQHALRRSRATRACGETGTRGPSRSACTPRACASRDDRRRLRVLLDGEALLVPVDRLGLLGQRREHPRDRPRLLRTAPRAARGTGQTPCRLPLERWWLRRSTRLHRGTGKAPAATVHQMFTRGPPTDNPRPDQWRPQSNDQNRNAMEDLYAEVEVAHRARCGDGGSRSRMWRLVEQRDSSSSTPSTGSETSVLVGAGSTLVAPLMAQWQPDYSKSAAAVTVTYGAIGSGGGVDAITNRTVDFGASDAPLTPDQATACKSCLQVPWALGATVVTYNVKGVPDKLHLSGDVVSPRSIWARSPAGTTRRSRRSTAGSLCPTPTSPRIYRSDSSGDSWVFTSYLSAVSPDWKSKVGASTSPVVADRQRRREELGRRRGGAGHRRRDRLRGGLLHRRRRAEGGVCCRTRPGSIPSRRWTTSWPRPRP